MPDAPSGPSPATPRPDAERMHRQIYLTIAPYAAYVMLFVFMAFSSRPTALFFLLSLAAGFGIFGGLIYWTLRIRDDVSLGRNERILWWALLWAASPVGLGLFLYFHIWLEEPVHLLQPASDAPAAGVTDDGGSA